MGGLGRALIGLGVLLVVVGVALVFADRLPFRLGRLPGDFLYRGRNTTIYAPLGTSLVLSVVLSLLMWLFNRR
jgi:Protein of unknown function (DUF2905)